VQDAVRRPLGLGDRLVRATGGQIARAQAAVVRDRRHPQPRRIPRHVGLIPLEPRDPVPVRREARSREEIRALVEDPRRVLAIQWDRDDRRRRLEVAVGVVLADREEAPATRVEAQVGVPIRAVRGDRLGLGIARVDPVEAPIRDVREEDRAAGRRERAATVLMDARPHIERRRRHILRRPIDAVTDQHAPTALGGPALDPEGVVAVDPRIAERDDLTDEVVDADRRRPAAVRQRRRSVRRRPGTVRQGLGTIVHRSNPTASPDPPQVPCCQEAT
jgi:hypothetical protein